MAWGARCTEGDSDTVALPLPGEVAEAVANGDYVGEELCGDWPVPAAASTSAAAIGTHQVAPSGAS